MKTKVNEIKGENEIKFPCLMRGTQSSIIILATEQRLDGGFIGTKICGDGCSEDGVYSRDWSDKFRPFKGTITLSNA